MRTLFIFLAFFFATTTLIAQAATTPQAAETKGSVSGTIYCDNTHTVARFARVVLVPYKKDENTQKVSFSNKGFTSSTDIFGNFLIPNVPEGDYRALTRQNGYIAEQVPTQQSIADANASSKLPGVPLTVVAGREVHVVLTSFIGASIGGRIRYDDGGYAIGIPISLLRKNSSDKWEPYSLLSSMEGISLTPHEVTDSLGRYYLSGLPEGEYQIVASLPSQAVLPQSTVIANFRAISGESLRATSDTSNSLTIYYGDTFHQSKAQSIKLSEWDHIEGMDISINLKDLHSIRGTLPTLKDVTIDSCFSFLTETGESIPTREFTIEKPDAFSISLIPAGDYELRLMCMTKNSAGKHLGRVTFKKRLSLQTDIDNLTFATK